MADDALLSICIPTFQRAEKLDRTLGWLHDRLSESGLLSKAEVCLSDNASADDTPNVIARWRERFPACTVHRQESNVGFSKNLQRVSRLAHGEYLLFSGDDDLIEPTAFAALKNVLALSPDVAIFSSLSDSPLDPSLWPIRKESHWMPSNVDVLWQLGLFHLTFLGNFVVRRTSYIEHERSEFYESLYPHAAVLLRILANRPAYFSVQPLFVFDEPHRSWDQSLLTAVDMARVATDCVLLDKTNPPLTRAVYRRTVRSIPRALLNRRTSQRPPTAMSNYSDLGLRNVLGCYRASLKFQILAGVLWTIGRILPTRVLRTLLGTKPRKVHFEAQSAD